MPEDEFRRRWSARPLSRHTFADLLEIFREWEEEHGIRPDARAAAA